MMKFSNVLKSAVLVGALGCMFALTGCSTSPAPVVVVDERAQITDSYELQRVLRGYYGVDALCRPLNRYGYPVDVYGNVLTDAPVLEVYNYSVAPLYTTWLWSHYHYRYVYTPGYARVYTAPGVRFYSTRP